MCHRCVTLMRYFKTYAQKQKAVVANDSKSGKMPTESNYCKDRIFREKTVIAMKLKTARATELPRKYFHEEKNIKVPSKYCNLQAQPLCDQTIWNDNNMGYVNSVLTQSSESVNDSNQQSWKEPRIEFSITVKEEIPDYGHSLSKITNEPLNDSVPSFQQFPAQKIENEPQIGFDITVKEEKSNDGFSTFNITSEALSNNDPLSNQSKQDFAQESWKEPTIESEITVKQEKSNEDMIINEPISNDEPSFEHSKQDSTEILSASFTCTIPHCKLEFSHKQDIINHYKSQHCIGPPPFMCPICREVFPISLQVRKHMNSHLTRGRQSNGEGEFKCPKCPEKFGQECALISHSKTHNIFKEYLCNACPKVYLSHSGLVRHTKSHMTIKELQCCFCHKQFPIKSGLRRHQDRVHGGIYTLEHTKVVVEDLNASRETNCFKDKKGETPSALVNQQVQITQDPTIRKEQPDGLDIFTQEEGSDDVHSTFKFTNKPLTDDESSSYQPTHDSTQKSWNEPSVGPDIAVKEEKSDDSVFRITNEPLSEDEQSFDDSTQKNENEPPVGFVITVLQEMPDDDNSTLQITKEISEKQSSDQINQNSLELSKGPTYANFPCVISDCKEIFQYQRDIINHYISQHDVGSSQFKCPVCAEIVALKIEVRNHLKTHLVVQYTCEYCAREFGTLQNLKRHLRTHTGERPHECPKCPKCFKTRSTLKVHIKTHNAHKGFKCNSCSKEFFSHNGLFLHSKLHTENKELQCKFCGRQFPIISRLQRHLKGLCGTRTSAKSSKGS